MLNFIITCSYEAFNPLPISSVGWVGMLQKSLQIREWIPCSSQERSIPVTIQGECSGMMQSGHTQTSEILISKQRLSSCVLATGRSGRLIWLILLCLTLTEDRTASLLTGRYHWFLFIPANTNRDHWFKKRLVESRYCKEQRVVRVWFFLSNPLQHPLEYGLIFCEII